MRPGPRTAASDPARRLLGALLAGLAVGSVAWGQVAPDTTLRHGDIEVVIRVKADTAYGDGALRWRGQPLEIDSVSGMALDRPMRTARVNNLFVVGGGSPPDLLVNVGDPNNASAYHLLRQDGGAVSAPLLCKTFGGDNAVRIVDGAGTGQRFSGPQFRELPGATRLMLGDRCLYDTALRQAFEVPRQPEDAYFLYDAKGVLFSPSGRQMARFAKDRETQQPVVLVANLATGAWSRLPVDTDRMRFADYAAIDNAWLARHFEWRSQSVGGERLVERQGIQPLPRRGTFLVNAAQYNVPGVTTAQFERLGEFLVRRFGGQLLSDQESPGSGRLLTYRVEQEEVVVSATGFFIARTAKPYQPGQPGDPRRQQDLIRRMGEAFDAELAEGRHEAMFAKVPASRP